MSDYQKLPTRRSIKEVVAETGDTLVAMESVTRVTVYLKCGVLGDVPPNGGVTAPYLRGHAHTTPVICQIVVFG